MDIMGMRAIVSAAHTDDDVDRTPVAFDRAPAAMEEGVVGGRWSVISGGVRV